MKTLYNAMLIFLLGLMCSGCGDRSVKLNLPHEIDLMEYTDGIIKIQAPNSILSETRSFGEVSSEDLTLTFLSGSDNTGNNIVILIEAGGAKTNLILPKTQDAQQGNTAGTP